MNNKVVYSTTLHVNRSRDELLFNLFHLGSEPHVWTVDYGIEGGSEKALRACTI